MSELVSVVIPAFNAEKYLTESILSSLKQTHRPLEVLVVNDGSTDGTVQLFHKLQERAGDVRLELIDLYENKGAANALNKGFGMAKGSFICWLSADDTFIDANKISRQFRQMRIHNADWSYYRSFFCGSLPDDSVTYNPSYLPNLRFLDFLFTRDPKMQAAGLMFRNPINGSSVMIAKQCLEEHGQFDPSLKNVDADGDLWLRYSCLGLKCIALAGSPVFYREHAQQTSKSRQKMSTGKQLTRLRIMRVLARTGILKSICDRLTFLFPLMTARGDHLILPKSTEFLCNYILNETTRENPLLRSHARRVLKAIQSRSEDIEIASFESDLEYLSETSIIRDFEQKLLE